MHKKTFELVEFTGEIDEMLSDDYVEVPPENRKEAAELIRSGKPKVNIHGKTPLSEFAREVKGGNRKERRAEAKRIRKMFK